MCGTYELCIGSRFRRGLHNRHNDPWVVATPRASELPMTTFFIDVPEPWYSLLYYFVEQARLEGVAFGAARAALDGHVALLGQWSMSPAVPHEAVEQPVARTEPTLLPVEEAARLIGKTPKALRGLVDRGMVTSAVVRHP